MRILLAEDQGMVRGALAALLNLEDDIDVIAEAPTGTEAWAKIQELAPDICLLDIEMPGLSGLDVAERIKEAALATRIVILTTFARPGYLQRALRAGVSGYLLKDAPVEELAKALRKVHGGGRVLAPELAMAVWDEPNPLTERERDVLALAGKGLSTADIAGKLFLSEGTVRNYVSEILHKVGAKNRVEAVRIAEEKGWL
ncbi:response regulator transcription factor [Tumebacillus flagellatus]|uniref:Transcriptional regulator n=1 Tax=Tumebacillus flagellatus TaxID=1157490 RepID=A0A074M791_9BACL|nr:response regulator transcription factor [Tumebacillus flagellatus]KEO81877.1 transcriptional regulator [Tumebacillus flagellatus]